MQVEFHLKLGGDGTDKILLDYEIFALGTVK